MSITQGHRPTWPVPLPTAAPVQPPVAQSALGVTWNRRNRSTKNCWTMARARSWSRPACDGPNRRVAVVALAGRCIGRRFPVLASWPRRCLHRCLGSAGGVEHRLDQARSGARVVGRQRAVGEIMLVAGGRGTVPRRWLARRAASMPPSPTKIGSVSVPCTCTGRMAPARRVCTAGPGHQLSRGASAGCPASRRLPGRPSLAIRGLSWGLRLTGA
jgi:hypothetical protein